MGESYNYLLHRELDAPTCESRGIFLVIFVVILCYSIFIAKNVAIVPNSLSIID